MDDYQRAPVLDADDRAEVPDYVIQELDRVWAANVNYWAAVAIYRRSAGKDELFNSSLEWGNVDRELFQRLFWRSPLLEQSSPELAALDCFMPPTDRSTMDTRDLPQPMSLALMTEIAFAQEEARTARDMEEIKRIQELRRGQVTDKSPATQATPRDTKRDSEKKSTKRRRKLSGDLADCDRAFKAARKIDPDLTKTEHIRAWAEENDKSSHTLRRAASDHPELFVVRPRRDKCRTKKPC